MPEVPEFRIADCALAYRGYNITNLGRSNELLAHPRYGPLVERYLQRGSEICSDVMRVPVDLVRRVREGRDTSLETYHEAIALIVAMELAQIELVEEHFAVSHRDARLAFGYSLGELTALAAGGTITMEDALRVPLAMSADCAELARDARLGVVFSRGPTLDPGDVDLLCQLVNQEGRGVVGISAILSPNTVLIIGQGDTLERFRRRMRDVLPNRASLRINPHCWPPLHTPIMWQRNIPTRAGVMMHTLSGGFQAPQPPVLSLVTGKISYTDRNSRTTMRHWVDHPQRLWDAVYETLALGVDTVIHVGPEPNLIPATFRRLSENVQQQIAGRSFRSMRNRAISGLVRPWLKAILPSRSALLRAPRVRHIILEDWLLDRDPPTQKPPTQAQREGPAAEETATLEGTSAGE